MYKDDLDTPCVLIDLDKVDRNITNMQAIANQNGIGLRPHAKTHKIPVFAHKQMEAGACGITVAKVDEAEVMVEAGICEILIAYPIVGSQKVKKLVGLAKKANITIALDSYEVASKISEVAQKEALKIGVLVEIDSGFGRVGTDSDQAALKLAQDISDLKGLMFKGLLTFAGHAYDAKCDEQLERVSVEEGLCITKTAALLRDNGLSVDTVSAGSTPAAPYVAKVSGVTEIRPGTYIFGDLTQVSRKAHALDDCALTVKVTVVSRPKPHRAVIDAGTKVFTMDGEDSPLGTGKGFVLNRNGLKVAWLTEEHGMLSVAPEAEDLMIGDTLEIIPVHCCAVINMVDEVAVIRGDEVEAMWTVAGRGKIR